MKPPSRVEVGPYAYAVESRPDLSTTTDSAGLCLRDTGKILLQPDNTPERIRETVLHEIMHAVVDLTILKFKGDEEEQLISAISPHLLDTLRRNPRLATYLLGD